MTRFAFGGTCGAARAPRHFDSAAARSFSSDARATAPSPRAEWPSRARRVRWGVNISVNSLLVPTLCVGTSSCPLHGQLVRELPAERVEERSHAERGNEG